MTVGAPYAVSNVRNDRGAAVTSLALASTSGTTGIPSGESFTSVVASQVREINLDSGSTIRSLMRSGALAPGSRLVAAAGLILLAAVACGSDSASSSTPDELPIAQDERSEIVLGISLYLLVDDAEAPSASISSQRDVDNLRRVLEGMNEIWNQAAIRLEARFIGTAVTPDRTLRGIVRGDVSRFFNASGGHSDLREPSLINGLYARRIGVVNGFVPSGTRSFFVTDNPSVHDRRVSSHEVGHILGLNHPLDDPNRLMFSGTNGMMLTEEEIVMARRAASGILGGVR